ncbi:endospore germination permease [Pseudoclostridium thermosuccinogenes]|uniref:GerAB/ArcD/ProY family transporter n=1 Tax=Clostridium thermosuccinogenes TaxID=84032 RepID=UPI002FDAB27A
MEKIRISSFQLFLLISGFLFGSTVILAPAQGAKNDAWLAILLGGAGGTLLMLIYASIALLNPSKTLVDILREKLGKVIGNIFAILYIWYFIHLASLVFRNFGEFICTVTYPETPIVVVIGVFAVVLAYTVNGGIEVMGRLSELLVPVIPLLFFIIGLSILTVHDFTAFLPILENGIKPVLSAAFDYISFPFGETVAFLMIFLHLNKKEKLKKVVFTSSAVSILLVVMVFFRDIFALGADLMSRATFNPHLTSLLIPGLNVESLVDINLLIGGGVKISVCVYAAANALSQIAGIDDYRKLTRAIVTFCVVLSVWVYENILEMFSWAEKVWPYYSIPFQIAIPLLLLLLSLWKKSKPSKANTGNQKA